MDYLPEHMGTATIQPPGPIEAGSLATLTLTYTAALFGIDDSGHLKISWRSTSDMAKPQFEPRGEPNCRRCGPATAPSWRSGSTT